MPQVEEEDSNSPLPSADAHAVSHSGNGMHAVHFLAGGVAGATVDAALFPIDTIKTRLQALRRTSPSPAAAGCPSVAGRGGIAGSLYAGFGINGAGAFLSSGTFFLLYELSKLELDKRCPQDTPSAAKHMLAASLADLGACSIRVPFEVLKQRLQAGLHRNTLEAARTVYQTTGLAGFYAGFGSTILREIPFDALEFATYEFLRYEYCKMKHVDGPNTAESAVMGASAGAVAAGSTCPLDVVKTRLMTQTALPGQPEYYTGVRDCATRILKQEGAGAFFKGIVPRVSWISGAGAIFFSVYEGVKRALS